VRSLDAWIGERKVGIFVEEARADGGNDYAFHYEADAGLEYLVSLTMTPTATKRSFEMGTFPPPFDMILPEGKRRQRIEQARKFARADSFSMLSYVGGNVVNRVRFIPPGADRRITTVQLPPPREIAASSAGLQLFNALMGELDLAQGIAGVQPKLLGDADEADKKLSVHERSYRGSTHILKGSTDGYPCLAANEAACLMIYRYAGLDVPQVTLSADGQVLLVERFDFSEDGLLGFEEVASLLGETSDTKYERDYGSALQQLVDYASPQYAEQIRSDFFLALLLNWIIGNGDAHLKNFGLLYRDDVDARPAPYYDIVSTLVYVPEDIPALPLSNDHYAKEWWSRQRLEEFGLERARLSRSELRETFDRAENAIEQGLAHLQEQCVRIPEFSVIGQRMIEIIGGRRRDLYAQPSNLRARTARRT